MVCFSQCIHFAFAHSNRNIRSREWRRLRRCILLEINSSVSLPALGRTQDMFNVLYFPFVNMWVCVQLQTMYYEMVQCVLLADYDDDISLQRCVCVRGYASLVYMMTLVLWRHWICAIDLTRAHRRSLRVPVTSFGWQQRRQIYVFHKSHECLLTEGI